MRFLTSYDLLRKTGKINDHKGQTRTESRMKYALMQTTYSPQKEMVVELYLTRERLHTVKLSLADIWDSRSSADDYMFAHRITDHKIVHITEAKLFKTRLANK